ncbi:MAG: hypothetical protein DMD91_15510 [Candidatus Rokuibacteriota bacterium]|nr:MAG: hypothetical protein DMD91_15510 [Candidatus Rokubacteria bacterium]
MTKNSRGNTITPKSYPSFVKGTRRRTVRATADEQLSHRGLTDVYALTAAAHARVIRLMEEQGASFNGEGGQRHREALFHLVGAFSMLVYGKADGRWTADLALGCGKTTSAVAFIAALHHMGLPFSIGVASEKVEALCQLYRDLIAEGVPEDKIGLVHSYGYDPENAERIRRGEQARDGYASVPALKAAKANETAKLWASRPYLLMCHAKLLNRRTTDAQKELLNIFVDENGKVDSRSALIYDEGLVPMRHMALSWPLLHAQITGLRTRLADQADEEQNALMRPLLDHLAACERVIAEEWARQTRGESARILAMPSCEILDNEKEIEAAWSALDKLRLPLVSAFLTDSYRPLRISRAIQGVMTFSPLLPKSFKRIICLDASAPIKSLMRADATIKPWSYNGVPFNGRVVDYSNLTIVAHKEKSGRGSIEAQTEYGADRPVFKGAGKVIREMSPDEASILFTFKTNDTKYDPTEALKRTLTGYGVTLNSTVNVNGEQRPSKVFLRWGQQMNLSSFSYAKNVHLCGVIERSMWDVGGEYLGRVGDLLAQIEHQNDMKEHIFSEAAYAVHQALGRGSIRTVRDGKASPMKAHIWFREPELLKHILTDGPDAVLPDARWTILDDDMGELVEKLRAVLDVQTEPRISIKAWKAIAGVSTEIPQSTFQDARDEALDGSGWHVEGQWIVNREQVQE